MSVRARAPQAVVRSLPAEPHLASGRWEGLRRTRALPVSPEERSRSEGLGSSAMAGAVASSLQLRDCFCAL